MSLEITTFVNPRPGASGPVGGQSLFKALGHPLAADRAPGLLARLRAAARLAVVDPLGQAAIADQFYGLAGLSPSGVYVQRLEDLGRSVLGAAPRLLTDLPAGRHDLVLVAAFDAQRQADTIRDLAGEADVISLDALRLPDGMLSDRVDYLAPRNFATNFGFFRDAAGLHTRITVANYWSLYGAADPALWLRLFDADGDTLAEWTEALPAGGGALRLDSREIRERFGLPEFCGSLFMHAVRIAGHDVVKYPLDIYGDGPEALSCTHDANAWPAELYAGLPAPEDGETVLLWVQNSHPIPIPAGGVGLRRMGRNELVAFDEPIAPFATRSIDVGALLPEARWPDQLEVEAGKHFVRPRYEIIRTDGRRRIAHANVERTDLAADPGIPRLPEPFGKGYIMPLPVPPTDRFRTQALPTPMSTAQRELPIAVLLLDADGSERARRSLGRVPRERSALVDLDEWLAEEALALPSGYGHLEFVYDFRQGGEADGWLHAIGRYEQRASGHRAETSFGAHMFNIPVVYGDEPQSYGGRPPGLSTRLFLRLGDNGLDTFCHLIYPASAAWRPHSATELNLIDADGRVRASERLEIPCGGSVFWRPRRLFGDKALREAGPGAYVQVRDATCRLFGYHGLEAGDAGFSLDHMFGF